MAPVPPINLYEGLLVPVLSSLIPVINFVAVAVFV